MNYSIISQLFVLGLTIPISFCWTVCTPILFFGFSISENKFKDFVSAILKYSIVKFSTQILFVFLLYLLFGKTFVKYTSKLSVFILLFFGIIFLFFGFFQLTESLNNHKINHLPINQLTKSLFPTITGFFSGLNLCLPKVFVLGYIFVKSEQITEVLLYTTIFTLGEILSPIIIIFVLISFFKTNIEVIKKNFKIFVYAGSIIFVILGITNILSGIKVLLKK